MAEKARTSILGYFPCVPGCAELYPGSGRGKLRRKKETGAGLVQTRALRRCAADSCKTAHGETERRGGGRGPEFCDLGEFSDDWRSSRAQSGARQGQKTGRGSENGG